MAQWLKVLVGSTSDDPSSCLRAHTVEGREWTPTSCLLISIHMLRHAWELMHAHMHTINHCKTIQMGGKRGGDNIPSKHQSSPGVRWQLQPLSRADCCSLVCSRQDGTISSVLIGLLGTTHRLAWGQSHKKESNPLCRWEDGAAALENFREFQHNQGYVEKLCFRKKKKKSTDKQNKKDFHGY